MSPQGGVSVPPVMQHCDEAAEKQGNAKAQRQQGGHCRLVAEKVGYTRENGGPERCGRNGSDQQSHQHVR